jgi:hypothetical protein
MKPQLLFVFETVVHVELAFTGDPVAYLIGPGPNPPITTRDASEDIYAEFQLELPAFDSVVHVDPVFELITGNPPTLASRIVAPSGVIAAC